MIKTKTITIDEDVHYTAKETEAKKFRGGFSEYAETLIKDDLQKKGVKILENPDKEVK